MKGVASPEFRVLTPSCRVLACLCLFLGISVAARWTFHALPVPPAGVHAALGRLPPSEWINGVLVAYAFSAFLLGMPRIVEATDSWCGLCHVGYVSVFYAFYYLDGSLSENFWAVFVAGLGIFGLEVFGEALRPPSEGVGEGGVG